MTSLFGLFPIMLLVVTIILTAFSFRDLATGRLSKNRWWRGVRFAFVGLSIGATALVWMSVLRLVAPRAVVAYPLLLVLGIAGFVLGSLSPDPSHGIEDEDDDDEDDEEYDRDRPHARPWALPPRPSSRTLIPRARSPGTRSSDERYRPPEGRARPSCLRHRFRLGRGAMGVVIAGEHRQLGRPVAIKQLPLGFGQDPTVKVRFVQEARLLASLDHPHIVPVFDFVDQDGLCLLVMEMLTGGTVWSKFTTTGLTNAEACGIVMATASALQAAHSRGILHRDIKPENLMFSSAGALKVTDFGIAAVVGGDQTLANEQGEVIGTPRTWPPSKPSAKRSARHRRVRAACFSTSSSPASSRIRPRVARSRRCSATHDDPIQINQVAPTLPRPSRRW